MNQRTTELVVGSLLDQRFQVVREVGQGAMGTVYEARHVSIGRRLAIKVLNRPFNTSAVRERFFHEARAAGAISHPHLVPVLDFGFLENGQPYMVMDFVDGEPLETMIQRQAPLSLDLAAEICAQLLAALEVIHGAGLVHRDIKPANIMLARVRRPRVFVQLLDFGVSRAVHGAWRRPTLTQVNEVLGTPAYFSPEQAMGREVDAGWDLWAVGMLLYEMLSGTLPFKLESIPQVLVDLINYRMVPLRRRRADLPNWIYDIVTRAHHPVPEQRFPSATAFLQALESKQAHLGSEEAGATVPFYRVEFSTPPPELLGQLAGGRRSARQAADVEKATTVAPQRSVYPYEERGPGSQPKAKAAVGEVWTRPMECSGAGEVMPAPAPQRSRVELMIEKVRKRLARYLGAMKHVSRRDRAVLAVIGVTVLFVFGLVAVIAILV